MGDMSKEPSMEEILSSIKRIIAEEGDETPSPRAPRRGRLEVVHDSDVAELETVADDDDVLELTPPAEAAEFQDTVEESVTDTPDVDAEEILELTPPAIETVEEPETGIAALVEADRVEDGLPETDLAEPEPTEAPAEIEALEAPEQQDLEPGISESETAPVAEEVLDLTDEIDTEEKVTLSNAAPAMSGAESMISVESEVAARHSLSALSSMVVVPESGEGNTLEEVVKAMLRPMLKEWLDAKLPGLVEEMVAKEITRITGGVR